MSTATVLADQAEPAARPGFADAILAFVAWIVASTVVSISLLIFIAFRPNAGPPGLSPYQIMAKANEGFTFVVGSTTISAVVALVMLWVLARRFTAKPMAHFFAPVPMRMALWAAISGLALQAALFAAEIVLTNVFGVRLDIAPVEAAMNPKTLTQLAVALAALGVAVPFFEEVLFRGFIFGWLKRVAPLWIAMILSSAFFAMIHGLYWARGGLSGWIGTGEIFLIGMLLAWWAARAKSLWPPFAVHFVCNAAWFILYYFLPGWP